MKITRATMTRGGLTYQLIQTDLMVEIADAHATMTGVSRYLDGGWTGDNIADVHRWLVELGYTVQVIDGPNQNI